MIDIELVKLLREHIQSVLQRFQREIKDCHTGYLFMDRKDEDCFENICKLFDYILNNNDLREVDRLKSLIKTFKDIPFNCHDYMSDKQWLEICRICENRYGE